MSCSSIFLRILPILFPATETISIVLNSRHDAKNLMLLFCSNNLKPVRKKNFFCIHTCWICETENISRDAVSLNSSGILSVFLLGHLSLSPSRRLYGIWTARKQWIWSLPRQLLTLQSAVSALNICSSVEWICWISWWEPLEFQHARQRSRQFCVLSLG